MTGVVIRRGYSDGAHGQIHWRMMGERSDDLTDLYCLHPSPFSGLAFTEIMPHLAKDRRVIAPDFPGHGGSDPFRVDASIADYAEAMVALVKTMSDGEPVDLLGFHTGCLVASEMSLIAAEYIRQMVLIDVPAFEPATRAAQLGSSAQPPELTSELSSIAPMWERGITRRIASQSIDRSFEMFTEQLRHGRAMHGGFHAGFTYDVEGRLPLVTRPTAIIASQSGLLSATRRAADLIPGAKLVERLGIKRAVLDEAAETTAQTVLEALSSEGWEPGRHKEA